MKKFIAYVYLNYVSLVIHTISVLISSQDLFSFLIYGGEFEIDFLLPLGVCLLSFIIFFILNYQIVVIDEKGIQIIAWFIIKVVIKYSWDEIDYVRSSSGSNVGRVIDIVLKKDGVDVPIMNSRKKAIELIEKYSGKSIVYFGRNGQRLDNKKS